MWHERIEKNRIQKLKAWTFELRSFQVYKLQNLWDYYARPIFNKTDLKSLDRTEGFYKSLEIFWIMFNQPGLQFK